MKHQKRWWISWLVFLICAVAMIPTFFLLSYLYKLKRDYSENQRGNNDSQLTTYIFQLILTLGVFLVNFALDFLIRWLTSYERQMTNSDWELSIISKLSILKFINACLIPMLSNTVDSEWFEPQGLVEEIIFIVIFLAIGETFRLLVDWGCVIKWIRRNYEAWKGEESEITQQKANQLYENDVIQMASTFTVIFVLFFTIAFFAPIIPGLSVLGIIGSINIYWILKWTILRRKIIKYSLGGNFIMRVSEGIKVGILLNAILAYVFFDKIFGRDSTANLIQLIIAALFFVIPVRWILEHIFVKDKEPDDEPIEKYQDYLYHYDYKNPITKSLGVSRLRGNSLKLALTRAILKKLQNQVSVSGKMEIENVEINTLGLAGFQELFHEQREKQIENIKKHLLDPDLRKEGYNSWSEGDEIKNDPDDFGRNQKSMLEGDWAPPSEDESEPHSENLESESNRV